MGFQQNECQKGGLAAEKKGGGEGDYKEWMGEDFFHFPIPPLLLPSLLATFW